MIRPLSPSLRGFQVFAKPAGPACNLVCRYCYYLKKNALFPGGEALAMTDDLLESYIVQHLQASPDEIIRFSWHGGEPTLAGLEFFRRAVSIQKKHRPANRQIANGMQTNGVLLDEDWGRFLAGEGFSVGLSLDGPRDLHDLYRRMTGGGPSFDLTMRGYEVLRKHKVPTDILCVVGAGNVRFPREVYGFFKEIGAAFISFLPLVIPRPIRPGGADFGGKTPPPGAGKSGSLAPLLGRGRNPVLRPSEPAPLDSPDERFPIASHGEPLVDPLSVPATGWGEFLCAVFDEWVEGDIGRIKIQIFEEAARVAFGQEHSLCLFRPECGDIPVVEHNGDFYPCDHYVDAEHRVGNIRERPLVEMLESPGQRGFGRRKAESLPKACRECEVLAMCHGECPKNRFVRTADGEEGGNYLCPGYRKFFTHIRPFVEAVAAAWRQETSRG